MGSGLNADPNLTRLARITGSGLIDAGRRRGQASLTLGLLAERLRLVLLKFTPVNSAVSDDGPTTLFAWTMSTTAMGVLLNAETTCTSACGDR